MISRDEKIIQHLNAALALLKTKEEKPSRNQEWFRETGRLTDKGIEHLNSLFAKGKTSYSIAKAMHMSYRAVSVRHDEWRKKNPNAASWIRQDGR
jgi:FixJ family two-component response regulator